MKFAIMQKTKDLWLKEFLLNISINDINDCWLWCGKKDKDGYGLVKSYGAHRFSYWLFKGVDPTGLVLCHTCDCRDCVNPFHLYAGSKKTNAVDAAKRNRFRNQHGKLSLTPEQVRAIRLDTRSGRAIADDYGCNPDTVFRIRNNLYYKWVV